MTSRVAGNGNRKHIFADKLSLIFEPALRSEKNTVFSKIPQKVDLGELFHLISQKRSFETVSLAFYVTNLFTIF